MKPVIFLCLLALSVFVELGCGQQKSASTANQSYSTEKDGVKFRVETVASGLQVPWAFAWLPNGDMLFTERPGRVRIIQKGTLAKDAVFTVPDVEPTGESGLMDITLHPDFAQNGYVYLAYSYNKDGKQVKVVRYTYKDGKFAEDKTIVDHVPGAQFHSGMRCRFGPDGKLYVTTGDSTNWNLAQQLGSLAGKVLRLNDDGSVPADNPFVNEKGARPEIWTYGNRNPQGLAWQPGSGLALETEHGPSGFEGKGLGGDEVNILEAGKNYGWPEIHHTMTHEGMVSPLLEYTPACAPGSAMFYNGDQFPALKGNFFFGCLAGKRIIRVILDGRKVVSQENLLDGTYGRIREMEQGPDGYIYFSTSNRDGRGSPSADDDRIMRLVPETSNPGK
jgi:glucose/arabinose dehydrogenase